MKTSMLIGSLFVAVTLAVAQQPTQPPGSTPPTFPQDRQQTPDAPQTQDKSQMPPDTQAPPPQETNPDSRESSQTGSSTSSATNKSVEGCLNESSLHAGEFTLSSASGKTYELHGSSPELRAHLGQQVRVVGDLTEATSTATPGVSTDNPDEHRSMSQSIAVSSIETISKSCQRSQ